MTGPDQIHSIFSEHEAVKRIVGTVSGYFSDLDALFRLQTEHFELTQTSLDTLSAKKRQLVETLTELWGNLKQHFEFEERHLAQSLGATLEAALKTAHSEIASEIANLRNQLEDVTFEGLSQPEVLATKTTLQDAIGKLTGMIEEHARDEEVLVKLIRKVARLK